MELDGGSPGQMFALLDPIGRNHATRESLVGRDRRNAGVYTFRRRAVGDAVAASEALP